MSSAAKFNNGQWIVAYAHSPLTILVVEAWLKEENVDPSRLIFIYYRLNGDEIASYKKINIHSASSTVFGKFSNVVKSYQIKSEILKIVANEEFILLTPHLLDIPLRVLSLSRSCIGILLYEEGLMSYCNAEHSYESNCFLHDVIDFIGYTTPIKNKILATYGILPIAFSGSENNINLKIKTHSISINLDACILISIRCDIEGITDKVLEAFLIWSVKLIKSRGLEKVGLRFHPDYKRQPKLKNEILTGMQQKLSNVVVTKVDFPLDFVLGEGRLIMGLDSTLLLYASAHGWEVHMPTAEIFNHKAINAIKKLVDDLKSDKVV
jgi:hypothetical protein